MDCIDIYHPGHHPGHHLSPARGETVHLVLSGPLHLGHLLALRGRSLATITLSGVPELLAGAAVDLLALGVDPASTRLRRLRGVGGDLTVPLTSLLLLADAPARAAARIAAMEAASVLEHVALLDSNPEVAGELRVGLARGDIALVVAQALLQDRVETVLAPHRRRRALYARMPDLVAGWLHGPSALAA